MRENIEFKKIREFGDLIGDTFLFIKQNFGPLMKVFLYMTGVFIICGMISSILTQLQLVSMKSADMSVAGVYGTSPFQRLGELVVNYIFMIIFMMLTYTSIYVTVLSYIAIYIEKGNQTPTVVEVWGYYKYYFLRVLGSGVLMTAFLMVSFLCCIIPGIYIFPAVSLFYVIMILENGTFSHAFGRSFKLLTGEWWITAAALLIIYIIFYACSLVFQLPALIITMVSAFTHQPGTVTKSYAFLSSISNYLALVFMIIPIVCSTLIYFNLVERKESSGLLGRIDDLGKSAEPNHSDQEQY